MKILVVNLLRLGDVISMASALKALRLQSAKNGKVEIHLLVNRGVESVQEILPGVDRVHVFERNRLQSSLVDANRPMFEAYDVLENLVESLSQEKFDTIYNFTHNRLSGWLTGLIPADKKVGLAMDGSGGISFGSAWFRHLNQQVDFEEAQSFNHADVFFAAAGGLALQRERRFQDAHILDGVLRESPAGQKRALEILNETGYDPAHGGALIALQITTSDPKKEWGDSKYRELVLHLTASHAGHRILILGAPQEAIRIRDFVESLSGHERARAQTHAAIVSLPTVVSLLEVCDLVITGDTSIKHMASASPATVFEIAAGSADPFRTGPWKHGDFVIASREACRPCGHSEKCHRTTHACTDTLPVVEVSRLIESLLIGGNAFTERASRVSAFDIYQVDRSEGMAQLNGLNSRSRTELAMDRDVALSVERSARRLVLESRDGRWDRMTMGTETRLAFSALVSKFPTTSRTDFRHLIAGGETYLRHAEGLVRSLRLQLDRVKESIQDPKRVHELVSSVAVMRSRLGKNPWTMFAVEPLMSVLEDDRSAPFTRYRRLADTIADLEIRIEMALKLIRGIDAELMSDESKELR
jgi:ADP-heptose:LPS heptosyltransferase